MVEDQATEGVRRDDFAFMVVIKCAQNTSRLKICQQGMNGLIVRKAPAAGLFKDAARLRGGICKGAANHTASYHSAGSYGTDDN